MMIVVPAFSTAEYGKNETVLTAVVGFVSDSTDHVREGVDKERTMIQGGRRNKKSPNEAWKAPYAIHEQRVEKWRNEVESVQEVDFRILRKIFHKVQVGSHMICRQDPSDVRNPKSSLQW